VTNHKYLVLRGEHIEISGDHQGLTKCKRCLPILRGLVPVWYHNGDEHRVAREAGIFALRVFVAPWVREIDCVIRTLQTKYGDNAGYIALGASPKLIKWEMKARGLPVCAVNASRGEQSYEPSKEFQEYLERKLQKLGERQPYVLIDFVHTGRSLHFMKQCVSSLRPQATVYSVATGIWASAVVHPVDFEINVLKLQNALRTLGTKHLLGRHKPRNPVDCWSAARNHEICTEGRLHTRQWRAALQLKGFGNANSADYYLSQKRLFAESHLLGLPELNLTDVEVGDLLAGVSDRCARRHPARQEFQSWFKIFG
jgi:hypothetical protein